MSKSAYAIFRDAAAAQRAVDALLESHFDAHEIRVLTRVDQHVERLSVTLRTGSRRTIPTGVILGGLAGAVLFPAAGALTLGLWVELVVGVAVGAAIGYFLGVLGGIGFWSERIEVPGAGEWHHAVLVGVETSSSTRLHVARRAFEAAGASQVIVRGGTEVEVLRPATR